MLRCKAAVDVPPFSQSEKDVDITVILIFFEKRLYNCVSEEFIIKQLFLDIVLHTAAYIGNYICIGIYIVGEHHYIVEIGLLDIVRNLLAAEPLVNAEAL